MNNLIFEFVQDDNSYVHFKKEEKSQKQKQKSENQGSTKKVEQLNLNQSGQNISKKNQLPPNPPQTLNRQKWLLNMIKAFCSHETFDRMKFLELWINYIILKWSFFETKFETAINIVETVLDEFESEVKETIQIPLQ